MEKALELSSGLFLVFGTKVFSRLEKRVPNPIFAPNCLLDEICRRLHKK